MALSCLVAAAAAQCVGRRGSGTHFLRAEVLVPLLLPMAASLGRWLGRNLCRIQVDNYVGYPYADLLSPWFDGQAMLYAGLVATALTTAALWARALRRTRGWPRGWRNRPQTHLGQAIGMGLLALGLGWYVAMAAKHLSHGATGSDPLCYLQMAIDLADTGTALHRFPLAELAYRTDLPAWPLVPVGYHPPRPDGWSATVWSIGWPLLLAPWYRLGSEGALLLATPTMVVLASFFTWVCARSLWPEQAWLVGGLAAWLLLTSREVVWRSLVPLADGAAMALVALALAALLRARQREPWPQGQDPRPGRHTTLAWSAVAGLAIGMAYFVRHPLLPLLLASLPLLMDGRRAFRWRAAQVLTLGCAALLVALPDLQYHADAMGSPWIPESPESDLLSWRYMGSGLGLLLDQGLLSRHELGFVFPLILYGLWLQLRQPAERSQATIMVLGFAGMLLFGLAYRALRLRDLLALFPFLALWAGRGLSGLWAHANRPGQGLLVCRAALLLLLWVALGARSSWTLQRLQDPAITTFGYLSAPQRRAYDQLAVLVPENAVLACGLGAGALAHYTGRDTVRPASWSADQFRRLADLLSQNDRPLYAVQDGAEMAEWLERARAGGHSFVSIGTLNLPTFAAWG